MRKRFFSILSVLAVSVVLIAVFVPSCQIPGYTIWVKATLCDAPWEGAVEYTLTGPNAPTPSPITGVYVSANFTVVNGNWTCAYVEGGPPEAYLASTTPSPTQALPSPGEITFTLNFQKDKDAVIEFLDFTINGEKVTANDPQSPYDVEWCDIIDVHYVQHVVGCEREAVTVKETSELEIHYYAYEGTPPPLTEFVELHVLDDDCAVVKVPDPIQKLAQNTSLDGELVPYCTTFALNFCEPRILGVETIWELEEPIEAIEYLKKINFLHIGECEPGTPGNSACCALFDLLGPFPQPLIFELLPSAKVELEGGGDVNPANNSAVGAPIYIRVT